MTLKFLTAVCVILANSLVAIGQTTYKLQPPSSIEISGTSTLSDWVVKSQQLSGEMTFTASTKVASPMNGTVSNANAALDVLTIHSEKGETMDNKMYAALKHEEHPRITFSLTQPLKVMTAQSTMQATGDVELAGVKRPMTFALNLVSMADNSFRFKGTASLKLSDFSIEPPTAMFGQIETGDEITVQLDLTFAK